MKCLSCLSISSFLFPYGCWPARAAADFRHGSRGPIKGGLPLKFPDDFPLYPGPEVVRSTPLGQRYIIEVASEDLPSDVAAFYAGELSGGRAAGGIVMPFEVLEDDERTAAC